jgi:hypothetical protein
VAPFQLLTISLGGIGELQQVWKEMALFDEFHQPNHRSGVPMLAWY